MRILIRISKWAILARRLGSVAVPLVVISILLHRFRLIASDLFLVAVLGSGLVALLAVLAALIALARLWRTGDQGWTRALVGLLFGTFALLPFAWYGNLALRYPPVTDIATADRGLLPLIFEPDTAAMPPPRLLGAADRASIFPNAETRTYPLGLIQTFDLVRAMVADRGWEIKLLREPGADLSPGRINARILTLPGWREEVVLLARGGPVNSVVDMRSASLNALHDFGSNGLRIEAFMMALDDAVTTLLRDNPNANAPPESDTEATPEVEDE